MGPGLALRAIRGWVLVFRVVSPSEVGTYMPASRTSDRTEELIEALNRAERFDDIEREYRELVQMRRRRWPDFVLIGVLLTLLLQAGRALTNMQGIAVLIYITLALVVAFFGAPKLTRFIRLDRAISRWKPVADARTWAGKHG